MDFSFQIPIPNMKDFMRTEDFHFALAHLVLREHNYRQMFWACQKMVLLDNGVHENGTPLPLADLLEAASAVRADAIIPPDWFHDAGRTLEAFQQACRRYPVECLWPVVQAMHAGEAEQLYHLYIDRGVRAVCFPYRAPWREFFLKKVTLVPSITHHMLSVNDLEELRWMKDIPNVTIDTGKPLRLAQNGKRWIDVSSEWRTQLPKLDMYREVNVEIARQNIHAMRRIVDGAA